MASRSEHQEEAEKFLAKAKAWMPDPDADSNTKFRESAMMCDLNARIAQAHATLASK